MSFFSLQCSPVVNSSVVPDKSYLTASSLESITISGSDILKTIRSLDTNKAHGHDEILKFFVQILKSTWV